MQSGKVLTFAKTDPVSNLLAAVSSDELYSTIVGAELDQTQIVKADEFRGKLDELAKALRSDTTPPFNPASAKFNSEEHWKPELHTDHDAYGIVSSGSQGLGPYVVVAKSSAGPAGKAAFAYATANPNMTIGAFYQSSPNIVASNYSERNARRLAALVGGAVARKPGVPVPLVMPGALVDMIPTSNIGDDVARPLLAQPKYYSRYNQLIDDRLDNTKLRFPYGVIDSRDPGIGNEFLVQYGALSGFGVVPKSGAEVLVHQVQRHREDKDNATYTSIVNSDRSGLRNLVQSTFVHADGQKTSSRSRYLWATSDMPDPAVPVTLKLRPVAIITKGV